MDTVTWPTYNKEYEDKNYKKLPTLLLAFTLVLGTGGTLTDSNIPEVAFWEPVIETHSTTSYLNELSIAEQITLIRSAFGLNISDLALVLSVTRPTIYAWLEGQEPKPESITHLQKLSLIANQLKQLNISRMDTIIRRPIFKGGRSLLDMLQANDDLKEHLTFLKSLAEKEALSRQMRKSNKQPQRSAIQAASDYSNSFYRD